MRKWIKVVYPGTFDPFTNGHLGVIKRAVVLFDTVIVAVAKGLHKEPLFTIDERVEMIKETLKRECYDNVIVESFGGLLVDYVREKGANIILRGLRSVSDFDYELQIANINKKIAPEIETIFMMTEEEYFFINSRHVKEVARLGGDVSKLVPPYVAERLKKKFSLK